MYLYLLMHIYFNEKVAQATDFLKNKYIWTLSNVRRTY